MKKITVYADFDFFATPQEIGTLGYECVRGNYMLEQQEASEIIEEVRTAIKDWRTTATELHIPHKVLEHYCNRWDNL